MSKAMDDEYLGRSGPSLNRYRSEQDVSTPKDFLDAVRERFGDLTADLACTKENAKAPDAFFKGDDRMWPRDGHLWLNPPFGEIAAWAKKCVEWRETRLVGAALFLLAPASVGTNWFAKHVHGKALVLALSPRIKFEGHEDPYPKDLMLAVYARYTGFDVWRWRP